jgi:hypothetical protein
MASESKIKVVNPVVELDGDEVWSESLPFYILDPELSLARGLSQACIVSCFERYIFVLSGIQRGETRGT